MKKKKQDFDKYRNALTLMQGVEVRLFMDDTGQNRALMKDFRDYLEQRAKHEGWTYEPKNLEVVYVPKGELTLRPIMLANPYRENIGFAEARDGLFVTVDEDVANRVRDHMVGISSRYRIERGRKNENENT